LPEAGQGFHLPGLRFVDHNVAFQNPEEFGAAGVLDVIGGADGKCRLSCMEALLVLREGNQSE